MARQTRQQRRQRRAQQQPALAGGPPPRPSARTADERGARADREPRRPERRAEHRAPGIWGVRFVQEAIAELKKVEWPDQKAVIGGTVVVLVACVIVGAWLWANDQVWQYVVQHVLLR